GAFGGRGGRALPVDRARTAGGDRRLAPPRPPLAPAPRGGAIARPASPDADQLVSGRASRRGLDAKHDPARRDGADLHRLLARLLVRHAAPRPELPGREAEP